MEYREINYNHSQAVLHPVMLTLPAGKRIQPDKKFRKDPAAMIEKEQLIQRLSETGCGKETAERIGTLYEACSYDEMLHQMKVLRCELIDEMHDIQRRVDRMDFLIRSQEKQMKERKDRNHDEERRTEADSRLG